ncbi:hypothetical protein [Paenibacillus tianjinensis]|uniref:Uncharacterized protein n=1 Tax=Paenibacillus tianjinensis TaxID=2810347 RepID=A0ABX7L5M1_9BACL|nr:hypothetical protein [Paenibacillus tianjinensis]QSF43392.1 hypothetical protein JRJ22_19185 [Paenibacillus tianjinensis]
MKYYGVATNQTGTSTIIFNLSDNRLSAENEAKTHCKKNGLTFQYLLPENNTKKGGATLTKYAKARKLNASKKR